MTHEVYEADNRRAEIDGDMVRFFWVSGNVRRSKNGVWKVQTGDVRRARRLARAWAFKGRLGDPVLH